MFKRYFSGIAMAILLLPLSLEARNPRLYPGYYLTREGDTVKCNIELENWNRNPVLVHGEGPQGPLYFTAEQTKGFGVYGRVDYISARVTYHTEATSGTDLPSKFSNKTETRWCFLKVLNLGNFGLFELQTDQRTVFFLSDHGSEPMELIYRVAIEGTSVNEDNNYREVLMMMFNKEGMGDQHNRKITRASYNADDLQSLVSALNGTRSSQQFVASKSTPFELFFLAGLREFTFPSPFTGVYSINNHFSPSISPLLGFGVFYNLDPQTRRARIGLSVGYSRYQNHLTVSGKAGRYISQNFWDSTTYTEHLQGSNSLITSNLFFSYAFNSGSALRYYAKAGLYLTFSFKASGITSDYTGQYTYARNGIIYGPQAVGGQYALFGVSQNYGDFFIGGGLELRRNRLDLSYYLPSYTGRFNGTSTNFKIGGWNLAYTYVPGTKQKAKGDKNP